MAINPEQGGKCWSCKYCKDIGTPDDNPSGIYYRKCTHSAYNYVDKCVMYCNDYRWDEKTPENPSSSSYSSSDSSYSSTSSSSSSSGSGCGKFIIIILAIAAIVGLVLFTTNGFVEKKEPRKESQQQTAIVYNVNSALNMRDAASLNSNVITTVPKGAMVYIIEKGTEYHLVKYGEYQGYCAADSLQIQ